jgi:hypothetical protein
MYVGIKPRKFVFIHIPKNAGSSIVAKLKETIHHVDGEPAGADHRDLLQVSLDMAAKKLGKDKLLRRDINKYKLVFTHNTYPEVLPKLKQVVIGYEPRDFFKWAVVRNPWDRMHSMYVYSKRLPFQKQKHRKLKRLSRINFHEWIRILEKRKTENVEITKDLSMMPRYTLTQQVEWTRGLDYVVKYEELNYGLRYVEDKIKLPISQLSWLNKTRRREREYRKAYDDETADIIGRLFKDDIATYKYRF